MWWVLLIGVAMTATILTLALRGMLANKANPDACPECSHEIGLNSSSRHCDGQDDHNGWSSDLCRCRNDYHWNYESRHSVTHADPVD